MPRSINALMDEREWREGDIIECTVDYLSSCPLGTRAKIHETHYTNGRLVVGFLNGGYGFSTYYARAFKNLSRQSPLLATADTFGHKEKKMATIDKTQTFVAVPVNDGWNFDNIRKSLRNVPYAIGTYDEVTRWADVHMGTSTGDVVVILSTVAVAEPIRRSRVRPL